MKKCCVCKETKNFSDFNKNKVKKDGLQIHCRECSRERFKVYYAKNREKQIKVCKEIKNRGKKRARKFIFDFFIKNPCIKCGEKDPVLLEFDHLKDKEVSISEAMTRCWSVTRTQKEIDKCQVLCVRCHRLKTAEDFGWYLWKMTRNAIDAENGVKSMNEDFLKKFSASLNEDLRRTADKRKFQQVVDRMEQNPVFPPELGDVFDMSEDFRTTCERVWAFGDLGELHQRKGRFFPSYDGTFCPEGLDTIKEAIEWLLEAKNLQNPHDTAT